MAKLRRRKSGAWGARITIPKDLRPDYQALYSKHVEEVFYAAPDCPPSRAQVSFSEWQAVIKNRIATLRANQRGEGHDLTQHQAHALAGEWYRWYTHLHEEKPGQREHWGDYREILLERIEEAAGEWVRDRDGYHCELDFKAAKVRKEIHPIIADECKTAQFLANREEVLTSTAMTMFLDEVLQEFLVAIDLLKLRAARNYSPDQHLQTLPEYRKYKVASRSALRSDKASGGKTAMRLFEGYITAHNLADGTVRRWRAVFTALDAYLAGRDFDSLSDDDAQEWVTALVTQKKQSPSTVMRIWVTALKAVGRWSLKRKHITRNPFADCDVTVPRRTRNRETKSFNTDEIKLILSEASAIKNTQRPGMAARRWVPWICAYTGARGGEITQLRGRDVIERDGIKALLLTPDAGSLKTRQARVVPIHEHLIAQGFLYYVKAKGKGPLFYNPAKDDDRNAEEADITNPKQSRAVGARNGLAAWIRSIGITDKEVSPTHGWRHAFKQIAARHNISDRVSDAITGHAPPTEGRAYGAPTLEDMANALKVFPRYEIDINPDEPTQPQATPGAPNSPRRSRATIDTNARLHRN
jgi:integrase